MKIAFIGSHGVGKTTLCFDLAARLQRLDLSVEIVKETARRCPLPLNKAWQLIVSSWISCFAPARQVSRWIVIPDGPSRLRSTEDD